MSALRKLQNDVDALEECWVHGGVAAREVLSAAEKRMLDYRAMEAIEVGPIQPAEIRGVGGDL